MQGPASYALCVQPAGKNLEIRKMRVLWNTKASGILAMTN